MTGVCLKNSATVPAVVIGLALSCASSYAGTDAASLVLAGKEIFHERCAICHGLDGVPLLSDVPEFAKGERLEKSDAELLATLKHGKGMMPAWGENMSEQDLKNVLSYVRVIAGNKVFDEKCADCHKTGPPVLRPDMPKNPKPDKIAGLDICGACNIESRMTEQEMLNVIKYIRTLSK